MFGKRGLSDIVTNVLIILLVLVAVGIIAAFVIPMLRKGGGEVSGVVDVYSIGLSVVQGSAFVDSGQGIVYFLAKRTEQQGKLKGLKIILQDSTGNSKVFENATVIDPLESKQIFIKYQGSGLQTPTTITIVPIIDLGNGETRLGTQSTTSPILALSGGGPVCGNAVVEASEGCDDGNTNPGDGCSAVCQVESGWTCSGAPRSTCTQCGNGVVNPPEVCDGSQFGSLVCLSYTVPPARGTGFFYNGTFAAGDCNSSCSLGTGFAGCLASGRWCGNGLLETVFAGHNESCDGSQFYNSSCTGRTVPYNGTGVFYNGTLRAADCNNTCGVFNVSGCFISGVWCGNGRVESVGGHIESCDPPGTTTTQGCSGGQTRTCGTGCTWGPCGTSSGNLCTTCIGGVCNGICQAGENPSCPDCGG